MPLVESLQNECIVKDHAIDASHPAAGGRAHALSHGRCDLALRRVEAGRRSRRAGRTARCSGVPSDPLPNDPDWAGQAVFTDVRTATTTASPEALWRVIQGIGGERGWYSNPLLWAIRGWADKLVGGVGLRRGRRHRDRLLVGDAVDFWRVEAIEPGCSAAAAGRDEGAGHGVARDAGQPGRRRRQVRPAGGLLPARAWPGACTGSRSCRSTDSSSRAWRTASPRRPKQRMPRNGRGGRLSAPECRSIRHPR